MELPADSPSGDSIHWITVKSRICACFPWGKEIFPRVMGDTQILSALFPRQGFPPFWEYGQDTNIKITINKCAVVGITVLAAALTINPTRGIDVSIVFLKVLFDTNSNKNIAF